MAYKDSFKLESAGAQTVGTNKDRWVAPFPGQVLSVEAVAGIAPAGSALTFDLLLNGTSVFGSSTKPSIAAGQTVSPNAATPTQDSTVVTKFNTGDVLSLSVTAIGSGTAGSDVDVVVAYAGT
jgi:hypothetical protein